MLNYESTMTFIQIQRQILCGDFTKVSKSIPDNSIDLIFTDPPYIKECLYLFEPLADTALRVLKPRGSFVSLCGHAHIPLFLSVVGKKLKYRWLFCQWQNVGSHPRMLMGIEVLWKPAVWFVKGSYPHGRGFLRDGIESSGIKNKVYKWQQTEELAQYYLPRLMPQDGIVFDPMAGSFTTALVAKNLGINWIACDVASDVCKIAEKRLDA